MADEEEKRLLLKQIKFLSDMINNAEQKKARKNAPISAPQSSVAGCSQKCVQNEKKKSYTIIQPAVKRDPKCFQLQNSLTADTSNHIPEVRSLKTVDADQLKVKVKRKTEPPETKTYSAVQSQPETCVSKHSVPFTDSRSLQLQGKIPASKPSISLTKIKPQPCSVNAQSNLHSSVKLKEQLTQRSVEVMAARDTVQKKIDDLRNNLAQMKLAKRRQKNSFKDKRKPNSSVCSEGSLEGRCAKTEKLFLDNNLNSSNNSAVSAKEGINESQEMDSHENDRNSGTFAHHHETVKEGLNASCSKSPLQLVQASDIGVRCSSVTSKRNYDFRMCSDNKESKDISINIGDAPFVMPSVNDNPVVSVASPNTGAGSDMMLVTVRDESQERRSSKHVVSTSKDNLRKDLEKTEQKLHCMRKKMGLMLKESPKKLHQREASQRVSNSEGNSDVSLVIKTSSSMVNHSKSVASPSSSVVSIGSASSSYEEVRPIPNRMSLKWVCHNTSPEKAFSLSSSPSVRSSQRNARKGDSVKKNLFEIKQRQAKIAALKTLINRRSKRSGCSVVRNSSASSLASSSLTAVTPVQTGTKPRFQNNCSFFQPTNSSQTKVEINSGKSTPVISVKSRYKLKKTSLREMTSSQLELLVRNSAQDSVSQRAAKVIKSKYQTCKVPGQLSQYVSQASQRASPDSTHTRWSSKKCGNAQAYVWHYKTKLWRQSQSSSLPLTTAASMNRLSSSSVPFVHSAFVKRQCRNRQSRTYNAYRQPWSGNQYVCKSNNSFSNWRAQQQNRWKSAFTQNSWKSVSSQNSWKGKCRSIYFPELQSQQRGMMQHANHHWSSRNAKTKQLQNRILLKRLLWIKKLQMSWHEKKRATATRRAKGRGGEQGREQLVMINGIVYKSSSTRLTRASVWPSTSHTPAPTALASALQSKSNPLVVQNLNQRNMQTVTVRGVTFKVNRRGTTLHRVCSDTKQGKVSTVWRVSIGGTTFVRTKDGILKKISDTQTRNIVNRVKQRSIALAAAKFKKDNTKIKGKHCLFFSRFGKCSRGEKCPFIHDPDKIAVCTRFLRGTCKVEKCLFSHKVAKEKMPVCAFFLKGVCTQENCPYLHVKVSQGADICQDFVSGFCPLADKCLKLHTLVCPHFAKHGKCPKEGKCRLLHRKVKSVNSKQRGKSLHLHSARKRQVPNNPLQKPEGESQSSERGVKLCGESASRRGSECSSSARPVQTVVETVAPPTSAHDGQSALSGESADAPNCDHQDLNSPQPKLTAQPAFISLADYSSEKSHSISLLTARAIRVKPSLLRKETDLQIKPRI